MTIYYKGREVELSVHGESDDIQIDEARFVDDGSDCDDEVIEYIYERYADELYTEFMDRAVMRAEAWADSMEDR